MHLNDARIVDIIGGKKDPGGERHLRDCIHCQNLAEKWEHHLEALHSLKVESVDEREMHRLGATFRSCGPRPQDWLSWIANLVRTSVQPVGAVRGGSERMLEYDAGPYRLVLHLTPYDSPNTISLHGQLLSDTNEAVGEGRIVLLADDGTSFVGAMDRFGEFHMPGVRAGIYSASWWPQAGQVCIPEIEVSTDDV